MLLTSKNEFLKIRLFWELAKCSIKRQLTYRSATLAGLVTNFFFGIIRAAILIALYDTRQNIAGISLKSAVTYAALTQGIIAYLSFFGWTKIMDTIYTGDISSDLLKPINYFSFWLAKDFGRAVVNFVMRGITLMFGYALIFDLINPRRGWQWVALIMSIFLSWMLNFSWRFLVNLSAFWIQNARGVARFFFISMWFFSGFLMPLRYYPEWVIRLSHFTPFPSMINTVVEIYLNILQGPELIQALLVQLAWALALIGLGQLVLKAGVRRLVILGG